MSEDLKTKVKITVIGSIVNTILAIAKVVVGIIAHSHALIIDGIHSMSDLLSDALVVIVAKIADQEPDQKHPYGHQRFETLGTVILGSILLFVGGAIGYDSLSRLFVDTPNKIPTWPAIIVAIISIISKEILYRITVIAGEKTGSEILIANAWHHRSDAFSSIVVLIGIAGAMIGIDWFDIAAAVIVSIFIAKIGWQLTWNNLMELVDTAPTAAVQKNIEEFIKQDINVADIHNMRCRKMGGKIFLDIHIEVSPEISVSEGHNIGDWITFELHNAFPDIEDITIHIDYEKDNHKDPKSDEELLPIRNEVMKKLYGILAEQIKIEEIQKVYLHYLDNKVNIEVFLPKEYRNSIDIQSINDRKQSIKWINHVEYWFK